MLVVLVMPPASLAGVGRPALLARRRLCGEPVRARLRVGSCLGLGRHDGVRLGLRCCLRRKVFLFGFGVGAGVVRSLADYFAASEGVDELVVMTGSRDEGDIIYKDWFDALARSSPKTTVRYVVSQPDTEDPAILHGYVQQHLDGFDFSGADVFVCGRESVCLELEEVIRSKEPEDCAFFVEGFH